MGDQSNDFVSLFHSLTGDTISDRKRNFNKFLKNPSFSTNKQSIHDALDKLQPKTYLEGLFRIDALIYFRHIDRLVEVIKEGNEVFISKILKQNWFFKEVFRNMDAEVLVNDFLPCLSLAMRMKVLKRISVVLDENKMDKIYDCLYERYGLFIANKFLHTCTKEKLEYVFNNEEILLKPHQVLHLFKKNSDLFGMYINYYEQIFGSTYDNSKVISYVADKNPDLLFKLEKDSKISVASLGKRTSKKIIVKVENSIIDEYDYYEKFLKKPVLIRKLGNKFNSIYFKRFPKEIEKCYHFADYSSVLRYCPKNRRYNLLVETYFAKVKDPSLDKLFIRILESSIMELNPPEDVILKWAKSNYDHCRDEQYLKYYPAAESIPLIKEKINVTSDISNRMSFVIILLEICKLNSDFKALEGVLKYICYRHRNEEVSVKQNILSHIKSSFKLGEFNKTHWSYILEMIKVLEAQNWFYFGAYSVFLGGHLEYLIKNGEYYEEYFLEYLKYLFTGSYRFRVDVENPEIEKKLIKQIICVFPDEVMKYVETENLRIRKINLISSIIEFSKEYPYHFIDLGEYDYLTNFLKEEIGNYSAFPNNDYHFFGLIENVIFYKEQFPQSTLGLLNKDEKLVRLIIDCGHHGRALIRTIKHFILKKSRNDFENRLLNSYFEKLYLKDPIQKITDWFLKNEPTILIPYFAPMCKKCYLFSFKLVKLLSHFSFDKHVREYCLSCLESVDIERYGDALRALRILLPTNEYALVIDNKFVPTKTKLDLTDKQMLEIYEFQCRLAKVLHKVEEPLKMISVVLKFCIGDYLQSVLPAFYGVFYRSPEIQLYQHIHELSTKAVSVRKHAVFLSCELFKRAQIMKILLEEDSNVSSQKHIFTATLKYFSKNPSEELLCLVVKNMSTIDRNDKETLDSLIKVKVPKKYTGIYIAKCWEFFESIKDKELVDNYLEEILNTLTHDRDLLISIPPSFVENVIGNYLILLDFHTVYPFVINYMLCVENSPEKYLETILKELKQSVIKGKYFLDVVCDSSPSRSFLSYFATKFSECFDVIDTFEEHLKIKLLLLRFDSPKEKLAENIVRYVHELIENFTLLVLEIFKSIFNYFIGNMRTHEKLQLLKNMIDFEHSSVICFLILSVISPINDDDDEENIELYQSIISSIKEARDPIVKIHLKKYLLQS